MLKVNLTVAGSNIECECVTKYFIHWGYCHNDNLSFPRQKKRKLINETATVDTLYFAARNQFSFRFICSIFCYTSEELDFLVCNFVLTY